MVQMWSDTDVTYNKNKMNCTTVWILCNIFLISVSKKFEIPTLDLKVYDDLNTEVDKDAFAFLVMKPDLGVLEVCLPKGSDFEGESLVNLESYIPFSPNLVMQHSKERLIHVAWHFE